MRRPRRVWSDKENETNARHDLILGQVQYASDWDANIAKPQSLHARVRTNMHKGTHMHEQMHTRPASSPLRSEKGHKGMTILSLAMHTHAH